MKITLLCVGKPKDSWIKEGEAEYCKRLAPFLKVESIWLKDDARLITACAERKDVIALDEKGKLLESPGFAKYLREELETHGAHISLVVGGAEGLPHEVKKLYPLISLSPLTFPHQVARLLLLEQVYRAVTLWQGTPYHK